MDIPPKPSRDLPTPRTPPTWEEYVARRREYREERESETTTSLEAAREAEKAAVAFAQTVINSGFLLNGGGVIALPAVTALFSLDAPKDLIPFAVTGGRFVVGLIVSSAASITGFFASAHKSDAFYLEAMYLTHHLHQIHYPDEPKLAKEEKRTKDISGKMFRSFRRLRYVAIGLCLLSVLMFIAGGVFGAWTVFHAPHKL